VPGVKAGHQGQFPSPPPSPHRSKSTPHAARLKYLPPEPCGIRPYPVCAP